MTVILILATFLVFIALDYFLGEAEAPAVREAETPLPRGAQPDHVEGFLTPPNLRYHPGHSWVMRERPYIFRVGADEFAAALLGRVDSVQLPTPGRWVRQGQAAISVQRSGETTELVCPIEGEVIEVNPAVVADPSILRDDPYGAGWLMTLRVPDETNTTRNLIPTDLVLDWMRSAAESLFALQPRLAGATAADGGRPVDDLTAALPATTWLELTRRFFLT